MKKVCLIIAILFFSAASCFAGPAPKKEVKRGNLLYNKGEFSEALKQYEEAFSRNPDSDVVNFDLGSALYKTGDYKKSVTHLEKSLVSEDESLQQKASYNTGNAKYKYGISQEGSDINSAVDLLKQSLRHYEKAIELDPKDEDAKYNHEFVQKELERLEQKQQQQQQESEKQGESQGEQQESQQQQSQQQQQESQQGQSQQGEPEEQQHQSQQTQEQQQETQEQQAQQAEQKESSQEEKEASEQTSQAQEQVGQMSAQEAKMLLDSYRHEEEPRGLYKGNIPTRNLPEAAKDW
jgi:Ca-activated chloride channel family protein